MNILLILLRSRHLCSEKGLEWIGRVGGVDPLFSHGKAGGPPHYLTQLFHRLAKTSTKHALHCIASNTRVRTYIYYFGISNAKKDMRIVVRCEICISFAKK